MQEDTRRSSRMPSGVAIAALYICITVTAAAGFDDGRPPRITEHPVSVVVARHDPVTLRCKADGRPAPDVTWTRDGEKLSRATPHPITLPGGNLFFFSVETGDAGVYRCVANNTAGQALSKNATLEVTYLRHEFRTMPSAQLVSTGESVVMPCSPPRGRPEPSVFWRKDGRRLDLPADKRLRLVDGANLAVQGVRAGDSGRYQCVAQNAAGTRETPEVLLQVAVPPSLQKGPQDTTALVGSDVEFPCTVTGDPPPDVLWRRSLDAPSPTGSPGSDGGAEEAPTGASVGAVAVPMPLGRVHVTESRALRITNLQLSDAGHYVCEADNKAGALSAEAVLTVIDMPVLGPSPPGVLTVEEGGDAVVECGAQGTPAPSLFWALRGNRSLLAPGMEAGRFVVDRSAQGTAVLTVKTVSRSDTGSVVMCSAVNAAGSLLTRTRLLVLAQDEIPPPVIAVGPSNQTVPPRSSLSLPCHSTGHGQGQDHVVSWYKDGQQLSGKGPRIKQEHDGSLAMQALESSDTGLYKCVASSRRGHSSVSAWLTVSNAAADKAEKRGTPPGPPSRPHVVSSTNTSVTLAWRRNNKAGSSPLIGYQVEMFGPEKDGWEVTARRVSTSSYTQKDLVPGVAYSFVIRAENAHGLSLPSELTVPIVLPLHEAETEAELGEGASAEDVSVIRLSQAIPVSATSVKLLWEVLDPDQVSGLSIYWRSVAQGEDSLHTLSVLQSGSPSLGFVVTGLRCYIKYQFFLVPFSHAGEGRPSNMLAARTLSDAPNAPPSNLGAHFLNVSTVSITWNPPPPSAHNGLITSYEVVVRGGDPLELLSNVTLTADSPGSQQLLLSNLSQQVTYQVIVAAVTSAGRGPFSNPIALQSPAGQVRHVTKSEGNDGHHPAIHREPGVSPGSSSSDLVTETWFMALLGSMVAVMVLLFSAILFLHRRQHRAKKSGYPHLHMYDSRSNGGVLSLKVAEAEAEVEGAPLCIAPRSVPVVPRMIWGTNTTLSAGRASVSVSGPEYAEARPLRSDCQGSSSEYAEVKSKYSLLSTFQGQAYAQGRPCRPHSGGSGVGRRGPDYGEGGCCSCDCESTSQCCTGSGTSDGSGSGSTVAYATTTLVETGRPVCRDTPPFPSLSWNRSCEPTNCPPQTNRIGAGHYSDTYQQNDISKNIGQKRTATTLNLKPQPWQKNRNTGQSKMISMPPEFVPSQLQSGLAFLRTPQYNDYAFCQGTSPLRD